MNFLALVVVADFDDYFFEVYTNENLKGLLSKKLYKNLIIIQTTTSS